MFSAILLLLFVGNQSILQVVAGKEKRDISAWWEERHDMGGLGREKSRNESIPQVAGDRRKRRSILVGSDSVSRRQRRSIRSCDEDDFKRKRVNSLGLLEEVKTNVTLGGDSRCVFPWRVVMLGEQGAGKSSLGNSFLGFDNRQAARQALQLPFSVGHGLHSQTLRSSWRSSRWLGSKRAPGITVVDTPGFNETFDEMEELMILLGEEISEVNVFSIVFKNEAKFSVELGRSLKTVGKLLGEMWRNVVVIVSFWSFSPEAELERQEKRLTQKRYANQLQKVFRQKLEIDFDIPVFFVDSHYRKDDEKEAKAYKKETKKLWNFLQNVTPWKAMTTADIGEAVRRERRRSGVLKERCHLLQQDNHRYKRRLNDYIEKVAEQDAMLESLRNTIEFLKQSCL